MENKNFAIDFHIHLSDYQNFRDSAYTWFAQMFNSDSEYEEFKLRYSRPDNFCNYLEENGVEYAVILAEVAPLTTGIASNKRVEDFCKGQQKLIPFCTLNPYDTPNLAQTLENLYYNHGFKGIKLYPTYNYFYPNDAKLYPLYMSAQKLNIPVLFHTGSSIFKNSRIKYGNPLFFDDIAVDFPELKIVMAHGGRGVWYDEALLMARLHENVYIEVSGLPPHKLLNYFPDLERFAHKFIFGSDWPSVSIKKNIQLLYSLNISKAAKEKIISTNAKKVLGLE